VLAAALTAVFLPAVFSAPPASASPAIVGGGSGFAALEVDQWRADTARRPYNLSVDYSSQGSSVGRQNFVAGLFDFGMSDIVFPPTEQNFLSDTRRCHAALSTCFKYVPVSAGGLGMMYNLVNGSGQRVTDLKLTRDEVCKIFTGQIRAWNDPELVATNPELSSFSGHPINVVARSDGAGESYVLSQFCIAVDPGDWGAFRTYVTTNFPNDVGDAGLQLGDPVSTWPTVLLNDYTEKLANGSDGVANTVADPNAGVDAITYDAAGYAKVRAFPVASVQNAAGQFTQPDENNVTIALAYAAGRGDGTFVLNFSGPDPAAYFPSTYSYALVQTTGYDPGKGSTLGQFLCYAISNNGQAIAPALRYARLSQQIVAISRTQIVQIPGAPTADQCAPGSQGIANVTPPGAPPPGAVAGGPAAAAGPTAAAKAAAAAGSAGTAAAGTAAAAGGAAGTTGTTQAAQAATTSSTDAGAGGEQAAAGQGGSAALNALAASSKRSSGPTNNQALWAILEGAIICALAVGITGWRKRASG
jgi:ABC-type phosphate transport system substrate-binding protein